MITLYLRKDSEKNIYYLGFENREIKITKKEFKDLSYVFSQADIVEDLKKLLKFIGD